MVYCMAIADGADEVRKLVREQMRQGADQVKIMCSGGVASPYDPLDSLQFSETEIAAATDEAKAFGRYVLAPQVFDVLDETPPGRGGESSQRRAALRQKAARCRERATLPTPPAPGPVRAGKNAAQDAEGAWQRRPCRPRSPRRPVPRE
jgi:hypothetical protein